MNGYMVDPAGNELKVQLSNGRGLGDRDTIKRALYCNTRPPRITTRIQFDRESAAIMGYTEALYLGEFVGLLFIWAGFVVNIRAPHPSLTESISATPATAAG